MISNESDNLSNLRTTARYYTALHYTTLYGSRELKKGRDWGKGGRIITSVPLKFHMLKMRA